MSVPRAGKVLLTYPRQIVWGFWICIRKTIINTTAFLMIGICVKRGSCLLLENTHLY